MTKLPKSESQLHRIQSLTLRRLLLPLCFIFLSVAPGFAQQSIPYGNLSLQNGDLLFVGAQKEQLSGAINRVTQRQSDITYDHVGILEVSDGQVYILHAIGKKGSVREPLDSLVFRKEGQNQGFAVYRLTEKFQSAIPEAIEKSKTLLGNPYNWSYVLNDSSLYCLDFVERAFRHAGIFRLEPMTFIDPKTGKTDSYWAEFYRKLGMEVPEGQPGCNPNGMAANEALNRIGELKK